MLSKERKWNHIKCSVKTTKGRKRVEEQRTKGNKSQKTITNMVDINSAISIITLTVSHLNASIERQRLSEWIKKHYPTICCLRETHFILKKILIEVQLIYNVALVSGVQQNDSVIYIHICIIYIFFFRFFSIIGYYKILNILVVRY